MNKMRCLLAAIVALVVMAGCAKKVDVALSTSTLNIAAEGESVEVTLTSNGDWTIDACPEWLTVDPTSGNGNATLTFTAPLNDTEATRSGEVHVSTKDNTASLTVTQEAVEKDFIVVSPELIESEAEGGTFTLTVSSNCDWRASISAEWISCEPTNGNGNGTVSVTLLPIEGDIEFRETNILFSGAGSELIPIHVIQYAEEQIYISVSPSTLPFDYDGGTQNVSVLSNGSWTATPDADWFTLGVTSGNGNAEVTVTASENEVMEPRLGFVTFLLETGESTQLTIKQDGAPDPHYLEVTPEAVTIDKDGGSADITISCDVDWTVELEENWVSLSATTGIGDGIITVTAEPNTISEMRRANVTVVSGSLSRRVIVTQEAGEDPVSISISPDSLFVSASGGLQHLSITANSDWRLVSSDEEWISFLTSSGTGDAELDIIVDLNESSEGRMGTVSIYHNLMMMGSVVVVQEGRPNIFETDVTELEVRPEGGEYTIQLTANQSWTTNSDSEWMTCTPESGNGNCALTVHVEAMESPRPRTGSIKIVGSTGARIYVTVNQHE